MAVEEAGLFDMEPTKQQKFLNLNRGLFLIRYAAADDKLHPPIVRVAAAPASKKDISFFLHPDHQEAVLWQPDTCLVVRAKAPGQLAVEVEPLQSGGSIAATVRLEPLNQGTEVLEEAWEAEPEYDQLFDTANLRILGHVATLGDVEVGASEWIAGPSAPLRIEGFSILWPNKPSDLDIRYAVKTARAHTASGRVMELGSFAGTRQEAMPIVGLTLQVDGPAAADFQFVTEAVFLGSPIKRLVGKRIVTTGPTGREPLVGLRLSLEKADQMARPEVRKSTSLRLQTPLAKSKVPASKAQPSPSKQKPTADRPRSGHVRVFRSRPK